VRDEPTRLGAAALPQSSSAARSGPAVLYGCHRSSQSHCWPLKAWRTAHRDDRAGSSAPARPQHCKWSHRRRSSRTGLAGAPSLASARTCLPYCMRQAAVWRWMRAQQYGQPGFAPHPPLHGFVYDTALRLSGARGKVDALHGHEEHGRRGVNVLLVWTPYEQVAHLLWHVAVRCESDLSASMLPSSSGGGGGTVRSSVVWCELPSSPVSPREQSIEASAILLELPPSSRSLGEVSCARDDWNRSFRHTLYVPGLHDCRHHACTVLEYLYPPLTTASNDIQL
jgi:hypothetical protein